jgi:uncharacterized protein (TIRG00374 family)
MRFGKVFVAYGLILLLYVVVLLMADKNKGFFEYGFAALEQLPVLMSLALVSYGLRYLRWYWLLRWSGDHVPALSGWWAYLSGFALTATPGKVGELLRIRYFGHLGVGADRVMSAFVFERALDLIVVFALAAMFIADIRMFWLATLFVALFLVTLVVAGLYPEILMRLGVFCLQKQWVRASRLFEFLAKVLQGCRAWIKPWPMVIGLMIGLAAWSLTSLAFVYLLDRLDIQMPWLAAFATYPMAMIAGAASMLPGGVGSTEAAIVLQMKWHGVETAAAILVAVVIRLGTMWFSVFCGLAAILLQEIQFSRKVGL